MIRTTVSLDEQLFKEIRKKAIDERVPFTKLVNYALSLYLNKKQADKSKETKKIKDPGVEFLMKISKFHMKGGPPGLARNHDKYTWE